jgi:hypothetical protein
MLVGMLRCETVYRRRLRLTRRLATYGFGVMIVGAAILDATVLSPSPTREQANVELPAEAVEAPALEPSYVQLDPSMSMEAIDEQLLSGVSPIEWLDLAGERPRNRIEYSPAGELALSHGAPGAMPIELTLADCAHGSISTSLHEQHPVIDGRVAGRFRDGIYHLQATCDHGLIAPMTLIVQPSR